MTRAGEVYLGSLSCIDAERGLSALAALKRLDQELIERRGGTPLTPSRKLLDQARTARIDELMRVP